MNSELKELLDLRNDVEFMEHRRMYEYCYSGDEIKILLDYISKLENKIADAKQFVKDITWNDGCIECEPEHTRELLKLLTLEKRVKKNDKSKSN